MPFNNLPTRKIVITLSGLEPSETKTHQQMWKAVTNLGKMSVFDGIVASNLNDNIGKNIEVEITENGTFKNISKFIGISQAQPEKAEPNNTERIKEQQEKDKSIVAQCLTKICFQEPKRYEEKDVFEAYKNILRML